MTMKTLKSLDISSLPIMTTAINIILSIIISVIIVIILGIAAPTSILAVIIFIPAIICGTILVSVYTTFIQGFLYNLISTKTPISIVLEDDGAISKISPTSTAIVVSVITTIIAILELIILMIIVPILLGTIIQTMMLAGQSVIAYTLYQIMMMVSSPTFIFALIVGGFIITFIYTLIGAYLYNYLGGKGKGAKVEIDNNSSLKSVNIMSLAIVTAVISLILGLITGIIMAISSGQYIEIIVYAVGSLIAGFVVAAILAALTNALAPRICEIKFELIDE